MNTKRLLTVILALAMVLTLVVPVMAHGHAATVDTTAIVDAGGAGNAPEVLAAWQWAEGFQSGRELTPNIRRAEPCTAAETEICVWAVVTDPNGIGDIQDVFFRVYHPDETFKVQVHMTRLMLEAEWTAAKALARNSGQMTAEESVILDEMLEKNVAVMYMGCWTYHTHQMAGIYWTMVSGVDMAGNVGTLGAWLNILPIVALNIDFAAVNYGPIVPGAVKWVAGSRTWGDGRPTVWNLGNVPAGLRLHSSAMVGIAYQKLIEDFNVQLLNQHVIYRASEWVTLWGPLLPCVCEQIDFSIRPQFGIPSDTYQGQMRLEIFALDNNNS